MLPDVLYGARKSLIDELGRRAAANESPGLSAVERAQRLNGLIDELIGTLRRGGYRDPVPPPVTTPEELERGERDLLRRYIIEHVLQHDLEASAAEMTIVSDWTHNPERRRLRDENLRLRALLDGIGESAAIFSPDGRVLYANRRTMQLLHEMSGVAADEIVGKRLSEIDGAAETGIGRPPDELLALARARQSFEVDVGGRTKQYRYDAIYAPDGTVAGVTFVSEDIHDSQVAQKKLDLLNKLSLLVGTLDYDETAEALAHVPIPELADWCAVSVIESERTRRTFIAHRDPAKTPIRDALMRALPNWDQHPLWQHLGTGGFQVLAEVSDDLVRRLWPDDEQYRLISALGIRSLMVLPLVTRGQIAGIMTLVYTAESRRRYGHDDPALAKELALHAAHTIENARLMKALKASATRFRIALAGARTIVYEQDRSMRYVWHYNPMADGKSTIEGKTHEDLFPPDEAAFLAKLKQRVLEAGESIYEEMDLRIWNDERRHYRQAIEPRRDRAGKIIGLVGAATDITEQQRAHEELSEALGFRERMMGILGHDLRNPLSTITLSDGLLLRRQDLPQEARDHVLRIRRAADRMGEMIETLLDFTRARFMGKIPIKAVATDLAEIVRGVVDELRAAWPNAAIELEVHGDPKGRWDPARMAQMLSNLAGNAITYGEPGTPVLITIDGERDDVILKIKNDGPPIPPALIGVLFEPFRRGVPEDRSPRGLGLGLYIVQRIVQAHGGAIDVESQATAGTTFTVRLPRAQPPSKQPAT